MSANWKRIPCHHCDGHGQVWVSSVTDQGPEECLTCNGTGQLAISERDRLAPYPGGRLMGQWPGRYAQQGRGEGRA